MIYFGKEDSNNLFRHTNNLTGNISQLSQTNPTCFFAHIKFLNWSYFITYGCGLDEISALEIIFNNLLLQHWGQIISEVRFYIVILSISYNSSIIFGAKIEISDTKWVEKIPIYIFSTFGSKINEFEREKSEKNEKIPKS